MTVKSIRLLGNLIKPRYENIESIMLIKAWNTLSNIGVSENLDQSETHYIVLTNRFSLIISLIALLNFFFLIIAYNTRLWFGPEMLALIVSVIILGVLWTNRMKYYLLSKWIICWLPVILLLGISIYEKKQQFDYITIQDFYSYRFMLMTTAIIPLLVNNTKNVRFLIFCLIPSFIGVVFFEVIHQWLGIGIHQMGFGYFDSRLYVFDFVVALAFLGVLGFLLNQRIVFDKHESLLQSQHIRLSEKNMELEHKNSFINEQNHEIATKSDEFKEANDALTGAKIIIEEQKQLLENQNRNLEQQVIQKTKDLSRVNEELIINNNELRQFSHTLSHNLKSPVATFQGLLNLMDEKGLDAANKEILNYLNDSVSKMQEVFYDMNEMLELRNTLYITQEEVDLKKLVDELYNQFYAELSTNKIKFSYNFNGHGIIKTNGKRLNGILYQLISNAIKFRSEQRSAEISIQLDKKDGNNCLVIRDNGIGIDLERYGNKLFYPYQRFNSHTCGKGLGLYLVKLQIQSLGGKVSISSEPESYTQVDLELAI